LEQSRAASNEMTVQAKRKLRELLSGINRSGPQQRSDGCDRFGF
jgi:hypothetical protein